MNVSIRSFKEDFGERVRKNADRTACISAATENSWTYADIASLSERSAAFLIKEGWETAKPVLSLLPNGIEQYAVYIAMLRFGGKFAPLSPMMRLPEILRFKDLVDASLCVLPEHVEPSIKEGLVKAGVKIVVVKTDASFRWLDGIYACAGRAPQGGESGQLYVATSGTTAEPKWMIIDGDRLWSSGVAFAGMHGFLDSKARFYNVLPMSYLGGLYNLTLIPLATGASVVLSEAFSGTSLLGFWNDVERFDVNVLWLAPTLARGLLSIHPRMNRETLEGIAGRIRASFLGMAPIDLETKRKFEKAFSFPVLENYALSETTFLTTETLDSRFRRSEGSVGEILPYVDVRFSEKGELEVKSPFHCLGYLQSDGRAEVPRTDDGYFQTGDLGKADPETHNVIITGRLRDIVKKGGYLVSLRELEIFAERYPAVAEAAAVQIRHDFYGEDVVVFVELKKDAGEPKGHLSKFRVWMTEELARFKWPARVIAVEEFPRTSAGKIRKNVLKERLENSERFLDSVKV
jgi:acyl-CoA synthetase (AMP-forming)/AMP-acid ligase II